MLQVAEAYDAGLRTARLFKACLDRNTRAVRREHRREIERMREGLSAPPAVRDEARRRKLAETVRRARIHSPFYRELLRDAPDDPLEAFAAAPVTARGDIVDSGLTRTVPPRPSERRVTWRTSGTSGEPYTFEIDRLCPVRHSAQRAFVYLEAGVPPGSRIIEILGGGSVSRREDKLYPSFRRFHVDYWQMSGKELAAHARAVAPALLYGNLTHLLQVADEAQSAGMALTIPFVCSSSETVLEQDRVRLTEVLGCRFFEIYGSAEANNVAYYLPGDREWTIFEPRVWVEILDERREPVQAGEVGEIVVTTLTEPAAPLIRYATGDMARVAGADGSGRAGMRLASLEGRACDAVLDAQGRRVSLWSLAANGFWARDDMATRVRRWQIHQHRDRTVRVRLELRDGVAVADVETAIREYLAPVLAGLPVVLEPVARIHHPAEGKFRAVTSDAGEPERSASG